MADTDGIKLSNLPALPEPLQDGDLLETIRRRPDDPERYLNYQSPAASAVVKAATETRYGTVLLAPTVVNPPLTQTDTVMTPDSVREAILQLLNAKISSTGGVSTTYNPADQTLTVSASSETNGVKIFGRNGTLGLTSELAEGDLPAIGVLFDIANGTVEHIYQRPKIVDGGGSDIDYVLMAVDGPYAICAIMDGHKVVVVPYNLDEEIQLSTEWATHAVSESSLQVYVTPGDQSIKDILMIKPFEFIIVTAFSSYSGGDTYEIHKVNYSNPGAGTSQIYSASLSGLGLNNHNWLITEQKIGLNMDDPDFVQVTIYGQSLGSPDSDMRVDLLLDSLTWDVVNSNLSNVDYPHDISLDSPLTLFSSPNDYYMEFIYSFYNDGAVNFSYLGVAVHQSPTYGRFLQYDNYISRGFDPATGYRDIDHGVDVNVDLVAPFTAKLNDLGYTTLNGPYSPGIGGVSAFVPV